jgi:hypothetical protein
VFVVNKDFFCLLYLLAIEWVVDGIGSNNLTKLITSFLKGSGAMSREDIYAKLLCLGADGVLVY